MEAPDEHVQAAKDALLAEPSTQAWTTDLTPEERAAAARKRAKQAFLRICQGVGPEAPKTTNESGGKQSFKKWQFRLFDSGAMFVLARVLDRGMREYGEDNWRLISAEEHINSVEMHAIAFLGGDTSDDHLGHMICRAMFALGVELAENPEYDYRQGDERGVQTVEGSAS